MRTLEADVNEAVRALYGEPHPEGRAELEVRFGEFAGGNFRPGVPWAKFARLRARLAALPGAALGGGAPEESAVEIFYRSDIRRVIPAGGAERFERKVKLRPFDSPSFSLRVALAFESPAERPATLPIVETSRRRRRWSFALAGGKARADLTEVAGGDEPAFEVELEWAGEGVPDAAFARAAADVFRALHGTPEVFAEEERAAMVAEVNRALGERPRAGLARAPFVEPRNLKYRDVVGGGLVGGDVAYNAAHKTDGVRKALIVHSTGTWLAYPPHEYALVDRGVVAFPNSAFVLDGEEVPPEKRRERSPAEDARPWFFAFDCLVDEGSAAVQARPHPDRLRAALKVVTRLKDNPRIAAFTKTFHAIPTPDAFFATCARLLDERAALPYEEDGLIFTPASAAYNPRTRDLARGRLRALTKFPDVCKWKPPSQLTIDFAAAFEGDAPENAKPDKAMPALFSRGGRSLGARAAVRALLSWDGAAKRLVPFFGTAAAPFDPKRMVARGPVDLGALPPGTVVEFAWTGEAFAPVRVRTDKPRPNGLDVAFEVWEDIHNPITEATMRGESFALVRKYHNRVKRALFDLVPKGGALLDIGSGFGGDVQKWRAFDRVVAVEPNERNRAELGRRLAAARAADKTRVVAAGGEDTAAVAAAVADWTLGEGVDAVSLMFSLTFFWRDAATLDALVATIARAVRPGGRVVFATADGDAIAEFFSPVLGGAVRGRTLELAGGAFALELAPRPARPGGWPARVKLEGSIVDTGEAAGFQDEYLAFLQDFALRLGRFGFALAELRRLDSEPLLNESERVFTSLYSAGVFVHDGRTPLPGKERRGPKPRERAPGGIRLPPLPTRDAMSSLPPALADSLPREKLAAFFEGARAAPEDRNSGVEGARVAPEDEGTFTPAPERAKSREGVPTPQAPPKAPGADRAAKQPPPERGADRDRAKREEKAPPIPLYVGPKGQGDDLYAPLDLAKVRAGPGAEGGSFVFEGGRSLGAGFRFATAGGPNALFHAYLKAFFPKYQETASWASREALAAALRRDLGALLARPAAEDDPAGPTVWEAVAGGALAAAFARALGDKASVPGAVPALSALSGGPGALAALFAGGDAIPADPLLLAYVGEAVGVDVWVFRASERGVWPAVVPAASGRPAVLVLESEGGARFETLGVERRDFGAGVQTAFDADDPLLAALRRAAAGRGPAAAQVPRPSAASREAARAVVAADPDGPAAKFLRRAGFA